LESVVRIGEVLSVGRDMPNGPESVGLRSYIECVFENDLVGWDAAQTLAAAEANEHALITAETPAPPHRRALGRSASRRRCDCESAARQRTPRIYLVNASGTHPLGDTEFAQAIWRVAVADAPSDHERSCGSPHAVIDLDQLRPL
jgi:hypothetical protein